MRSKMTPLDQRYLRQLLNIRGDVKKCLKGISEIDGIRKSAESRTVLNDRRKLAVDGAIDKLLIALQEFDAETADIVAVLEKTKDNEDMFTINRDLWAKGCALGKVDENYLEKFDRYLESKEQPPFWPDDL